ncbi:CAP domain-containing protein [Herpetosiphon llansteffanensis]|uniref:CAP domain-containing protein n=1 Tax=Herpetosiphon llansteffanensis TaxID=2094568 RepID=UPI000D7D1165|nr:CAP domain-containing protein [Herpetosiphon llansteffanensis]
MQGIWYWLGSKRRWLIISALMFGLVGSVAGQTPAAVAGGSMNYLPAVMANPLLDIHNRQSVVNFYTNYYKVGMPTGWTGNASTCTPGTTNQAFRENVLARVNYYRLLAGMGTVSFDPVLNAKAQQAALMMSRNRTLNHNPPSTWLCYTAEGKEAAGKSNLAGGITANGTTAIELYMDDTGTPSVGHRRWLLYPPTLRMGTGDVDGQNGTIDANSLWVVGNTGPRPATRTEYIAWPPAGFVPFRNAFKLWSFSLPNANFANATVTMQKANQPQATTIVSRSSGSGDNTIVWEVTGYVTWPVPTTDITYTVNLSNVVHNGQTRSFSYQVTIIDPNR